MFFFEIPTTGFYCYLIFLVIAFQAYRLYKKEFGRVSLFSSLAGYGVMAFLLAICVSMKSGLFDTMRLLSIGLFPGGIIMLLVCVFFAFQKAYKGLLVTFTLLAAVLSGIYIDAFFIEPRQIEVSRYAAKSNKLHGMLRIGILSDLQTDDVGTHEERAIELLLAEKPDLILLPGDYIQDNHYSDIVVRENQIRKLNALLKKLKFSAPRGVFAVGGNVDDWCWPRIFRGLAVQCLHGKSTVRGDDFDVTGLSLDESYNQSLQVSPSDRFHIVLGHVPDFALGINSADLCVAGHTHGGQVQIPGIGPIITLSAVGGKWGAGGFFRTGNKHLLITRGVGMERSTAPRLRFCCPPEIVILDMMPEKIESN